MLSSPFFFLQVFLPHLIKKEVGRYSSAEESRLLIGGSDFYLRRKAILA